MKLCYCVGLVLCVYGGLGVVGLGVVVAARNEMGVDVAVTLKWCLFVSPHSG